MNSSFDVIHGSIATELLKCATIKFDVNSDVYWKLKVAEMIESKRCNIPLKSLELYVYEQPLIGMQSFRDYYLFLTQVINEYNV